MSWEQANNEKQGRARVDTVIARPTIFDAQRLVYPTLEIRCFLDDGDKFEQKCKSLKRRTLTIYKGSEVEFAHAA